MLVPRCRPALALTTALTALALSFGAAHVFASDWTNTLGLDVWNLPEMARTVDREDARDAQLAASAGSLWEQIAASAAVTRELADGRVSLAAAVGELGAINRDRPGFAVVLEARFMECRTDRDRLARWAIEEIRWRLAEDPTRLAAVVARLEAEYAALPRAGGGH